MASLYYESEFAHHGILGMKWGQRRYQNRDGTLTPRGQKRYSREMQKAAAGQRSEQRRLALEKAKIREARKTEKARLDLQKEKAALRDEKRNAGKRQISKTEKEQEMKEHKKKISEMSDSEISAMINRMTLEKNLKDLMNPKEEKAAASWFSEVAKTAGKSLVDNLAKQTGTELGKMLFNSTSSGNSNDPNQKKKK